MISTIIFDLNLTLVALRLKDPGDKYLKSLGVSKTTLFNTAVNHWEGFETGKYGQGELARRMMIDLNLPPEKGVEALRLLRDDIYLIDGMEQVLAALRGKYRVLLLAGDGEDFLRVKLDKFNLARYFDNIYCTCFEGMRKINPQIYRNVLKKEEISAEECLFIDDNPEFIQAAQSVGLQTIQFKNSAQLREDLKNFSIFL